MCELRGQESGELLCALGLSAQTQQVLGLGTTGQAGSPPRPLWMGHREAWAPCFWPVRSSQTCQGLRFPLSQQQPWRLACRQKTENLFQPPL